jgi:PAS domain S-box-containing protein
MRKKSKIKFRLLLGILVVLALGIISFDIYISQIYRQSLGFGESLNQIVEDVEKEFDNLITLDTQILESSLDVFLENQSYKDVYLQDDRQALFELGEPLFKKLEDNHDITHFYFHLTSGDNFLRLHNKDIFGDKINRFTFQQARSSQEIGSGIELGKTAFALRVVKPYLNNGELVGYVEFGNEIDHVLDEVKSLTDKDLLLVVDKQFLNHNDWQSLRQVANLPDNWDDFEKYLVIDSTISEEYSESLQKEMVNGCLSTENPNSQTMSELKIYHDNSRSLLCGNFYIHDAGDRQVGNIIVFQDVTDTLIMVTRFDGLVIIISVILYVLVFIFYNFLLNKIIINPIKTLQQGTKIIEQGNLNYKVGTDSNDEIGELSKAFDKMVKSLAKARTGVDRKVNEQTKEIIQKSKESEKQQSAILNILEDVEEEKIKSESLAQDLKKFELAVDNASDHIVITNPDGVTLYANKAVERITGFPHKAIIGRRSGARGNWGGQMPREFYNKLWKTIRDDKKTFAGEIKNKRKSGEFYDAYVSISPILNDEREVIFFVGIERDITKEKEIDRAKTEFVSLASHQLRTPLSTINWYSEMLLDGDVGKLNDEQENYLKEVYKGNQRMVELVNALLNVSRLELGTFAIDPEKAKIVNIAKSVVNEMKPQIKARKIVFTNKFAENLPEMMLDKKLIRMVIQNLLSNAVKYTPEGGKVDIQIAKKGRDVEMKVLDTGMGIPKRQQSKIFSKLFRADNVKESDTEGTGLGLYIVKSIVEHSGGKVWFESIEKKGTTFYVTLPLKGMKKKEGAKELS